MGNWLTVYQIHEVCWELGNGLAVLQLVCNADLELRQTAQRVDLVDDNIGQTVYTNRIACNDCVEPAGTARTAGNGTELAACIADVVTGFIEQLGRERTLAHTGGVGLEDTHDLVDGSRADTGTDAAAACYRMRRGNIRIGAHVEVEQRALCTLEQHFLAGLDGVIGHNGGVAHHRTQTVCVNLVLCDNSVRVDRLRRKRR